MKKTLIITLAMTMAVTAFAQTNYVEQRDNLLNQIRENPDDTNLHHQLGSLELFSFQNPDAAAFHYATASTTGIRYDILHNEAVAHAQAGRFEQAAWLLTAALEQPASPQNHATTLELLGDVHHTAQNYEQAAETYATLFELTNNPEARYKSLRARYANGETTTLTVALQELRKSVTPHASELLALIYQTAGMTDYAINELNLTRDEAITAGDLQTLARVSTNLAQLHYENGDTPTALATINDVHLITNDQTTSYTEGVIHLSNGNPQEAFDAFTRGLPIEELSTDRLFGAVVASASMMDNTSTNRYTRALLNQHGAEIFSAGALPRLAALAALESFASVGDTAAVDNLTSSLNLTNFQPDELLQLGTLHYNNGNYADAINVFTILAAHPQATQEQQLAATRNHAHALQANKQHASAIPLYREYLNTAAYDTDALYHLGWALFHTNNDSAAEDAWTQASNRGYAPATNALKHLNN